MHGRSKGTEGKKGMAGTKKGNSVRGGRESEIRDDMKGHTRLGQKGGLS